MKLYKFKLILAVFEILGALYISWLIDIEEKNIMSCWVVLLAFFGGMNVADAAYAKRNENKE